MSGWDPPVFVEYPPGYQYRGGQTEWHFPFICVNRQQIRDKPEYAISEFQWLQLSKRGLMQNLFGENDFNLHENRK